MYIYVPITMVGYMLKYLINSYRNFENIQSIFQDKGIIHYIFKMHKYILQKYQQHHCSA